ncbi:MAG: UDP-glucose/GDP-mannose dehydrogenase family protein [Desulfobacteraceae bacterium]|nr:UDP-glucose/GDP-mannose dehydrogenase family protein [Desulfobacteraceae bacterium]MBC2755908.1 UDP-glucose/GDP-mannose dehydrogenase family protein [Desulfobacteraceae bacterium]
MNVCIIGTGYVGLVTAACFAEMGNQVYCVDINPTVIETLNNGGIHIYEPGLEDIVKRNLSDKRLTFMTDIAEGMENSLFIFNCVGTPPNSDGSCDLSYVFDVAAQVGRHMKDYKIIINKSTVPVGTADNVCEIIQNELKQRKVEIEFDVVSNPEFLKEGDAIKDFMKPDRIIIGTDNDKAVGLLEDIYAPFARSRDKFIIMGVRSAEMTKYAANCMLATKISFINEIANICESVGADIKDVRVGIGSDHRIGYHFIYPGVGYGGSCFPKDVNALIQTALSCNYTPELLTAVDGVNNRQKLMLAEKIHKYYEPFGGVKDKVLALWGLSFKANTDDIRDSASLVIIRNLAASGMKVRAYDPAAGENAQKVLVDNPLVEILDNQYGVLDGADAMAVATDWNQFRNPDFDTIKKHLKEPVIFDGRNLYSSKQMSELGFRYFGVGRQSVD